MSEVVDKPTDAALDAMNATLRRMHATKPSPHKPPQEASGSLKKRGRPAKKIPAA